MDKFVKRISKQERDEDIKKEIESSKRLKTSRLNKHQSQELLRSIGSSRNKGKGDKSLKSEKVRAEQNALTNKLSNQTLDLMVKVLFLGTNQPVPGTNSSKGDLKDKAEYGVPFIFHDEGTSQYWFNPKAFSNVKEGGYYRKWGVVIHGVIWRWYNNYAQIPLGFQVSHLSDQKLLVTPDSLNCEPGDINKGRVSCIKRNWNTRKKPGCECVICPHEPICKSKIIQGENLILPQEIPAQNVGSLNIFSET